ncbi:plasmid mobilization protein [Tateyamaria sp. SN6-1]|uniref:plasmid mobilization protein n=1 Tax=Tateyamaria sp. SN6-1 TaxID=3092148 RepID=UPI0039F48C6D
MTEKIDIRCTKSEKLEIREKAEAEGIPVSALLREQLGLVTTHRRKSVPRVSQLQIRKIASCCLVLEDIARDVRSATKNGQLDHRVGLSFVAALIELRRMLNSAELDISKFERIC